MTLILRVPGITFPTDGRPKIVATLAADPFTTAGVPATPWVVGSTSSSTPAVSGGVLMLETPGSTTSTPSPELAFLSRPIAVPKTWSASAVIAASSANSTGGADAGQAGLFVGTSAQDGFGWAINRTSMINGTYMTWGSVSARKFTQTGPNGVARITDMTKAPGVGKRIGVAFDGTALTLTVDGVVQGTVTPPASYATAGTLHFGFFAQTGAKVSFDDFKVTM